MKRVSQLSTQPDCCEKTWKKSGLNGNWTRPWPLRHRCSTLSTELSGQLGFVCGEWVKRFHQTFLNCQFSSSHVKLVAFHLKLRDVAALSFLVWRLCPVVIYWQPWQMFNRRAWGVLINRRAWRVCINSCAWHVPSIDRRAWHVPIDSWLWRMFIDMHFNGFFDDSSTCFAVTTAGLLALFHPSCYHLIFWGWLSTYYKMNKQKKWHHCYGQDRHQDWNIHASSRTFASRISPIILCNNQKLKTV